MRKKQACNIANALADTLLFGRRARKKQSCNITVSLAGRSSVH